MAVEKSYARLGLFVVVVVLTALATAVSFVQRGRRPSVLLLTCFPVPVFNSGRSSDPPTLLAAALRC